MRFGRTFQKHQVPVEWMTEYVDYDALKKVLKTAAVFSQQQQQQKGTLIDLSDFECRLNYNIDRIAEHYNRKREDCSARFQFLKCCSAIGQETSEIDRDFDDTLEALTELKYQYQLLSWFGDINRRALFRIVRKIEKRRLTSTSQCQRWLSRISAKAFAFNGRLLEELRLVEQSIVHMSRSRPGKSSMKMNSSSLSEISLGAPMISMSSIPSAIGENNASALESEILGALNKYETEISVIQNILLSFLWHSIIHKSESCIILVMQYLQTFDDDDSIGGRNIFHRVVIRIGQLRFGNIGSDENDADYTTPAEPPSDLHESGMQRVDDGNSMTKQRNKYIEERDFNILLEALPCHQSHFLFACDSHGRNTLHFAALYGLSDICQQLIERMKICGTIEITSMISSPKWQDSDGYTPFQLALIHGHVDCASIIVRSNTISNDDVMKMALVLRICTKLNHLESLKLLLEIGVDPTICDENGESILQAAARFGHRECTATLLETPQMRSMINYQDDLLSSTALIDACRSGHIRIVELLARAGANAEICDALGWSAKEHAAFRGYHGIVECLENTNITVNRFNHVTEKNSRTDSTINQETIEANKSTSKDFLAPSPPISNPSSPVILANSSSKGSKTRSDLVAPASNNQSIIIVTLGTMNPSKAIGAVMFDPIPTADAHLMHLDSTLSLVVSANGADDTKPVSFDLPVFDDARAEPILFSAVDLAKVKLIFDVVPTVGSSKGRPIGRGVALLASVGHQQNENGLKKGSLQGDHCTALIGINTFDIIGSVNFNLRIVAPFSCPEKLPISTCEPGISRWIDHKSTMIIGHRGLGKNMNAHKALQIGENTIQSFSTAAKLGASFVEFDVQLTKDYVPVIYHDFLVGETGIDAPMHALTLEQFLYLNRGPSIRSSGSVTSSSLSNSEDESSQATSTTSPLILPKPEAKVGQGQSSKMLTGPALSVEKPSGKRIPRVRSASMSMTSESSAVGVALDRDERLKLTHSFKSRGFKANSKDFIQEPFTTLEEMFRKLPRSIGFNIEMKYPMMWEAEAYNMDPYAIDLNTYVDTILQIVFRLRSYHNSSSSSHSGSSVREIVFSSFHPDLCLLLRLKQSQIPVLFLTDAGCNPDVGDVRATSLQEAVRFASRWDLLGIVSVVDPLIKCPRLVGIVKGWGKRAVDKADGDGKLKGSKDKLGDKGLVCVSYGTGNNVPENAKLQADAGIDAVIVDHVLAVHRGLNGRSTNSIGSEVSSELVAKGGI